MKKFLATVVAVAFTLSAASLLIAEEKKASTVKPAPAIEKKAEPTTAATPAPTAPVAVKIENKDLKADCLKKFPGKTEKDAEVAKCLEGTKVVEKKAETAAAKPVTTPVKKVEEKK